MSADPAVEPLDVIASLGPGKALHHSFDLDNAAPLRSRGERDAGVLHLTLCEFATNHKDGTFSVVRGGIQYWELAPPTDLQFWLLVEIPPNTLPDGPHELELTIGMVDGPTLANMKGAAIFGNPAVGTRVAIAMGIHAVALGACKIDVRIGAERADLVLDLRPLPVSPPPDSAGAPQK